MNKNISFILVLFFIFTNIYALESQVCNDSILSTTPDNRYSLSGNEVIDKQTDLIWQKCSLGQNAFNCSGEPTLFTWQQALQTAEDIRQTTGINWRLPNINELETLLEEKCAFPAINLSIFPNTALVPVQVPADATAGSSMYWSSSPFHHFVNFGFYVYFYYGATHETFMSHQYAVRLVRDET